MSKKIEKTNKYIVFCEHLAELEGLNRNFTLRCEKALPIAEVKNQMKEIKIRILEMYSEAIIGKNRNENYL
jgi:hypothetical protein